MKSAPNFAALIAAAGLATAATGSFTPQVPEPARAPTSTARDDTLASPREALTLAAIASVPGPQT